MKPGYKQTEAGVIPEEWEVKKFGEVAVPRRERIDPKRTGVHDFCIELEHIESGRGQILGSTSTGNQSSLKSVFYPGDVLFGKLRAYLRKYWLATRAGVCSTEIWVLVPRDAAVTSEFLFQIIQTDDFIDVASNSYGTHMPRSDWNVVQNHKQKIPSLPEQRAIATALSDVDALLRVLDRLIAKKRNLKQAVMQQLLTGQTRLPGFHGEWEVKQLGSLLAYEQPTKYLVSSSEYSDANDVPVLTAGKTFILGYTNEDYGIFSNLPVIIFDDFTTATKYVTFPFKAKSSAMKLLKPRNPSVNLRFVFELMQLIVFKPSEHKRYWISEYQKLEVKMPDKKEQSFIMIVLSDMDAELAALEARRDKTRDLKQAMMQELLTGKTRLVSAGVAHA